MLGERLPRRRQVLYINAAGYTACRDSARGGPFRSSRRVPRGWGLLGTLLWASSGSLVAPLLGASSATPTLADFVFFVFLLVIVESFGRLLAFGHFAGTNIARIRGRMGVSPTVGRWVSGGRPGLIGLGGWRKCSVGPSIEVSWLASHGRRPSFVHEPSRPRHALLIGPGVRCSPVVPLSYGSLTVGSGRKAYFVCCLALTRLDTRIEVKRRLELN